ncbi:An peroxidase domain containing protein, partial [Trichuris trichiura]
RQGRRKPRDSAETEALANVDKKLTVLKSKISGYNNLWATYFSSHKAAKNTSYSALILLETTKLLRKLGMTLTQINEMYSPQVIEEVSKKGLCQREPIEECAAGGFRTFSGYCNNVVHPMWGAVFQAFSRLVAPSYQDGISTPRESTDGLELPTASLVSQTIFTDSTGTKHPTASLLLAQWAQFVYDDLVKIGTSTVLKCCDTQQQSTECFPIRSAGDTRSDCIPYSRTLAALNSNCSLGERQQANQATSFLDASMIYGNDGKTAALLRSYKDGKVYYETDKDHHSRVVSNVNLTPTQAALYTVWVLQHNRIAERLKEINEFWDDERIFRETRKIIGAQIQHITFNEFLPMILGSEAMENEKMALKTNSFSGEYDMEENPSVLNEYAAAAGLFFYSLMPENMFLPKSERTVAFASTFYDPEILYTYDGLEDVISIGSQFRNAFLSTRFTSGVDLMAIFIQMGRDHGIPSYVAMRNHCDLEAVKSFEDLESVVQDKEIIQKLKRVENIDLLPIGLAEKPLPGSFIGPTFACIIRKQFAKVIVRHDRYWYESFFYPSEFSSTQLIEIRKTTLARILCDNVKSLVNIQPAAFMTADNYEFGFPWVFSAHVVNTTLFLETLRSAVKLAITKETIENAVRIAEQRVKDVELRERQLQRSNTENFIFGNNVGRKKEESDIARTADILLEATKVLIEDYFLDGCKNKVTYAGMLLNNERIFAANATGNNNRCNRKLYPCDLTSPYRTITGWCNNLKNPSNGMAFSPFRRLLKPAYNDGFSEPRKFSSDGSPLPSPRKVANVMHPSKNVIHKKYSHFLMMFGQFLDHDMTHTPMTVAPDGSLLECSACNSSETVSSSCWPIPIPNDDPYFPPTMPDGSPRCMHFVRSLIGQLTLGYREQLNQLTSYIDASNVYGSNDCTASDLRLFTQGKLNYTRTFPGIQHGLPFGFRDPDCKSHADKCFMAGDIRVNENSGLMVPHILFVSEHNRIADRLYHLNSFWSDEKIYQETRKIIGAVMQHITFKEWLPKVLGNKLMDKYGLQLKSNGYYDGYDQLCDATIANEFATAAFRFGHTLIREDFLLIHPQHHSFVDQIRLKNMFFNITPLQEYNSGGVQLIAAGLLRSPSMAFDRYINQDLRNHLFEFKETPFSGMDLPALNIQRARDHGIPGYNAYRQLCGLPKAKHFTDLVDSMDDDAVRAFSNLYHHVDDIDLFPGLISERSLPGALVGPTLGCIIGEQMKKLRNCDRFWYENNIPENRFTPGQLAEIRKTSLAGIICNNMDRVKKIQPRTRKLTATAQYYCISEFRCSKRIENCDALMNRYLITEVQEDTACFLQCCLYQRRLE